MTSFNQRLLTVRVLEMLERRVKQFRRREELWPIRVPAAPIALDGILPAQPRFAAPSAAKV